MPKSARYHIDRANSIVFTSKRLPLQPLEPPDDSSREFVTKRAQTKLKTHLKTYHVI